MANTEDWTEEIPKTTSAALAALEKLVSSENPDPKLISALTNLVTTLAKIESDHKKGGFKVNVNL